MQQLQRTIAIPLLVLVILLVNAGFAIDATATERAARAPRADAATKSLDAPDALGITGLSCRCSLTEGKDGGRFWLFKDEPEINAVDPDGPAAGQIKPGDVIVAIDGYLITTRQAGVKFANVIPGEEVELTIRRGSRMITRTILPGTVSSKAPPATVRGLDSTTADYVASLSRASESLARYATELSKTVESMEMPDLPDVAGVPDFHFDLPELPEIPELPEFPEIDILPEGCFGFGLSFSGTIRGSERPPQWRFDSAPKVRSVTPGSPADLADIERGDVLTHIDGDPLDSDRGGQRFSSVEPGQTVTWTVRRRRDKHKVEMTAVSRTESPAPQADVEPVPEPNIDRDGQKVRFTGSLGETDVEVRGDKSVEVTVNRARGEILIISKDATIRLRLSEKSGDR